jgi:hypothetical protein
MAKIINKYVWLTGKAGTTTLASLLASLKVEFLQV